MELVSRAALVGRNHSLSEGGFDGYRFSLTDVLYLCPDSCIRCGGYHGFD